MTNIDRSFAKSPDNNIISVHGNTNNTNTNNNHNNHNDVEENNTGITTTITRTSTSATRRRTRSLGVPMHPVSKIEIAEMTKIIENAHRYLQIAFAEDLYLCCQANNINFSELRDALKTKWNVNILEPREGIGGHCLPKDTKMFLQSSKSIKSKILTAAVEVDQDYRIFRAQSSTRIGT
jgi:UDP-N-acetyl-D-mannosaminuronic acid dehydrogenase